MISNRILDLSYGNPDFLAPYWMDKVIPEVPVIASSYLYGAIPELQEAIKTLHKSQGNATIGDKHVVVGVGASQVLTAILACLRRPVRAPSPYFMRFPNYANNARVHWNLDLKGSLEIITLPNNPDGMVNERLIDHSDVILDCSYNWKQYTNPIAYDYPITVFSLAKATGHAATRIGWALIEDKALAKAVTEWIEISTGGVSLEAQKAALSVIQHQVEGSYLRHDGDEETVFDYGKRILGHRWNKVKSAIDLSSNPLLRCNYQGMFLWGTQLWTDSGETVSSYFGQRNIKYSSGELFGMTNDYFRLNIGCSTRDFNELMRRIK